MADIDPNRRFQIALDRSRAAWAAADRVAAAARAGCNLDGDAVLVPFFGGLHRVTHPGGEVTFVASGRPAHASIVIVLLHYLLTADGTPPADRWVAFRDLPDGLFYAPAFAAKAENPLAAHFGSRLAAYHEAAAALGGMPVALADAAYRFAALPRLAVATLLWEGDDEFPPRGRILFDAHAGHYLPAEDLSGIGDWLAHRLTRQAP